MTFKLVAILLTFIGMIKVLASVAVLTMLSTVALSISSNFVIATKPNSAASNAMQVNVVRLIRALAISIAVSYISSNFIRASSWVSGFSVLCDFYNNQDLSDEEMPGNNQRDSES